VSVRCRAQREMGPTDSNVRTDSYALSETLGQIRAQLPCRHGTVQRRHEPRNALGRDHPGVQPVVDRLPRHPCLRRELVDTAGISDQPAENGARLHAGMVRNSATVVKWAWGEYFCKGGLTRIPKGAYKGTTREDNDGEGEF
jgi:hypothetical protein